MGMKSNQSRVVALMTQEQFERLVRDRARFSHMVLFTKHAMERMEERNITRRMVLRTLGKGSAVNAPKWDADYASWIGAMHRVTAGASVTVRCAIVDGAMTVTVVTAHP